MDWSKGFSAQYYAALVDPGTWRSINRLEITGGSIKRVLSGLRQSADIDFVRFGEGERWIRIHLVAKQGNLSENVPLFTGLSSAPDDDIDGKYITNQVQMYSVLKPADDVLLQRGYYVPAGADGARVIMELLSVSPAPVIIEGTSPALASSIIAEDGESCLSMAERVLTAINWRLMIDGNGTITLCPKANEISAVFDPLSNDMIEPQIKRTYDWYACPNVFRGLMDGSYAVARDDDPDSPLSTVSRGREIWKEESSCKLAEGESLPEYVTRRLKEEQQVSVIVSYDRRYDPVVNVSDLIQMRYPEQRITGRYQVTSQSIELGYGARLSEEVASA